MPQVAKIVALPWPTITGQRSDSQEIRNFLPHFAAGLAGWVETMPTVQVRTQHLVQSALPLLEPATLPNSLLATIALLPMVTVANPPCRQTDTAHSVRWHQTCLSLPPFLQMLVLLFALTE